MRFQKELFQIHEDLKMNSFTVKSFLGYFKMDIEKYFSSFDACFSLRDQKTAPTPHLLPK